MYDENYLRRLIIEYGNRPDLSQKTGISRGAIEKFLKGETTIKLSTASIIFEFLSKNPSYIRKTKPRKKD